MGAAAAIIVVLVCLCAWFAVWCWLLNQRIENQDRATYYYETTEWAKHDEGVRFSMDDETMDSLVYLPGRKIVCWFNKRNVAHVQNNGTFVLKWPDGGRMVGTVHPMDDQIELVGLPGTSEDGVTETLVRSK